MKIEVRDAYGTPLASGTLTVHDAPGIDDQSPSVRDLLDTHLIGKSVGLELPGMPSNVRWYIRCEA